MISRGVGLIREKCLFDIMGRQEEEDGKTGVCDNRDRAVTCVFCRDLHFTQCFPFFYKRTCSKEGGVWRKVFTNKIIVTFVTQRLVSFFLSRPVV